MNITDVKIYKNNRDTSSTYLGTATIVIDNAFVIYGIRIYEKAGNRYITFPSKIIKEKWVNVCHPINREARKTIEDSIFAAYDDKE